MSLRARLVVGLLALATVGLVALAAVTYASQRNFLYDRVDGQVQAAAHFANDRGGLRPFGITGTGSGIEQQPTLDPDAAAGQPPPDRGGDRGPGGGPAPGTWFFYRTAAGRTIAFCPTCYSTTATAPALPGNLPQSGPGSVKATNTGKSYRVLAESLATGGQRIVAVPLAETDQTLHRLLTIEGLVIAAILAALAAGSWWLVRIGLRPLERMGDTAGAIAAGELSHRVEPADQRTEVGRLGLALNRMLDRLEQAFAERQASEDRLRRFLADASHELRTPLASIRGYAELFRIGAARDPADTDKAMRRIEAEAARMGVLVEDLLTLARLDEVRDVIREDVDLTRLAGDQVDDARATAPDREITLESDGPARVSGDPHQLRQVLGNLVRNALVHTPAGTPIEVSVAREGDRVVLAVRDHGPGLPTEDADALFDRFWRAEAGRGRGRAGAGLGLAIVAGIVAAHGGEVAAGDAEGGGACFTVRLPALPAQDGQAGPSHDGALQPEADAGQLL